MCLAIPAQVVAIDATGSEATVAVGGVQQQVSLALIDEVAMGDYLLIHVGYALNRIDPVAAEQTLALFAQMAALDSGATPPTDSDHLTGEGAA